MLSELVRRVTGGRGVGEFIATEIAAPLGLDLWVGLPGAEAHRVGRAGRVDAPEPSSALRTRPKRSVAEAYNDPDSTTVRAFAAITPPPTTTTPPIAPRPSPPPTASPRPTVSPVSTPR